MIINKTTIGFVTQQYDTETGHCIHQDFIAGDQVDYEDENGEPVDWREEKYQPFDMIQPNKLYTLPEKVIKIIEEEKDRVYFEEGYEKISGGYVNAHVNHIYDNGWEVLLSHGVQCEDYETSFTFKLYLRKDTLEWTEDKELVNCIQE